MEPPASQFDDPALKAALRRSLPVERAPESLRQRIQAMRGGGGQVAPADVADVPVKNFKLSWHRWGRLAAAAVFAIAAVVTAVIINRGAGPDPDSPYAIPNSVFKAMVKAHEERKNAAATPDTITTLASAADLSKALGRGVLAADLTRDGWKFEGGAVRNVGSFKAGQLYFTKGKASASVLSLPASAATVAKVGSTYDISFQGTPIAGYVKQGGLFCIVGQSEDGSLTTEEVKSLLLKHRDEIVKS